MIGLDLAEAAEVGVSLAPRDGRSVRSGDAEDLLAAARRGDPVARWDALEECRDYLRLVARRNRLPEGQRGPDTSDVIQNTILEGWRGFGRFQGNSRGQLRGWLRVILVRSLMRALRRRPAEDLMGSDIRAGEAAGVITPASSVARRNDANRALESALGRLPEHYRLAIHLRLWDDLSFPEMGRKMGLSEDSARKLFARAVIRLREIMGPEGRQP